MRIQEPARLINVVRSADVVVAGGGIAGVSAALAASRSGAGTVLLEKECALGGLATLGLIVIYLPLCDGYGHQVIGGIGEELLRESVAPGNTSPSASDQHIPDCWNGPSTVEERTRNRFRVNFEAAPMILSLERLLREAGVEIWYDTRVCAAMSQGGSLTHVIVENKSGRLALEAKAFVDATGDADLCRLAGEKTAEYTQNRKSGWYFSQKGDARASLHSLTEPPLDAPCPPGTRCYRLSGGEISAYVQDMHAMISHHARTQDAIPFLIPTLPLMRMTRRLVARETLCREQLGAWREDAVAMTGDWRHPAPVYTIGLNHLMGRCDNLFSAGRCIGSHGDAWDVTRAIPACAATGQAAGMAAAMLAQENGLDVGMLQSRLRRDGAILDRGLTGSDKER